MNLFSATESSASQPGYFDALMRAHASQSLKIFQTAKARPGLEAEEKLRQQALGYYQELAGQVGVSTYTPTKKSSEKLELADNQVAKAVNKVIVAKLSFSEKKIFIDELLAQYSATAADKREAFLARVDTLLKNAEEKSEVEAPTTATENQMLRLYYAQQAGGVSTTEQPSLLDYLS